MIAALFAAVLIAGRVPVSVSTTVPQPRLVASNLSLPGIPADAGVASNHEPVRSAPLPLTVSAADADPARTTSAADAIAAARDATVAGGAVATEGVHSDRVPIFYQYQVVSGDSVGSIAARFGVAPNYVVWNNNDVIDRDVLVTGSTLQVPSVEGIIHSVRYGESLSEIAARYDADPREIIEFAANGLQADPNRLQSDIQILVPGGRKLVRPAASLRPTDAADTPAADVPDAWAWPAAGRITSVYGPTHPLGIDIAAPTGAPVLAARAGTVVFAGGNPCCSYGLHVIVDHGDGYETLYAHLSTIGVVRGQPVATGDLVGAVGNTGRSTGPHVHFELTRNDVPQDPLGGGFLR